MEDEPELSAMPYLGDEAVDDARFYEDLLEIYSGRVDGSAALVAHNTQTQSPIAPSSSSGATSSSAADPVENPSRSELEPKSTGSEMDDDNRPVSTPARGNKRGTRTRPDASSKSAMLNATIGSTTASKSQQDNDTEPRSKRGRRSSLAATKRNSSGSAATAVQIGAQTPGPSTIILSLKALDDFTLSDMVEFLYTRFDDWAHFDLPAPSTTGANPNANAVCASLGDPKVVQQQQKPKATAAGEESQSVEGADECAIFKPTPNDMAIAPMAAAPLSLFFSIASLVEHFPKVNHYTILRRYCLSIILIQKDINKYAVECCVIYIHYPLSFIHIFLMRNIIYVLFVPEAMCTRWSGSLCWRRR